MVLSFIGAVVLILTIGTLYYFWKETEEIELEGVVIRKLYEATKDRYYFIIEVVNPIFSEYAEYSCSKEEWSQYKEDDVVLCNVTIYMNETIIKSIKKHD